MSSLRLDSRDAIKLGSNILFKYIKQKLSGGIFAIVLIKRGLYHSAVFNQS